MNRVKLFLSILCFTFLVGCKSTNLTCTKTTLDNDIVRINQEVTLIFKEKKLINVIESNFYKYKTDAENNMNALLESLKDDYANFDKSKGINTYATIREKEVYFELKLNIDKLTEEERTIYYWLVEHENYTDAYKNLEKEGYSCK